MLKFCFIVVAEKRPIYVCSLIFATYAVSPTVYKVEASRLTPSPLLPFPTWVLDDLHHIINT